jgi:hypothetical protein
MEGVIDVFAWDKISLFIKRIIISAAHQAQPPYNQLRISATNGRA